MGALRIETGETDPGRRSITRRRFVLLGGVAAASIALGGGLTVASSWTQDETEDLLRATMGDGMSTVLVVYGTKSGCTAGVAERIGARLAAAGLTVDVAPAEDRPDPAGYDGVVVGSGIRMGQWHSSVKEWVAENADALKVRPTALYTVCLTIASEPDKVDEVRAYTDPILAKSGIEPVDLGLFGGWFEPKQFSFVERTVLKAMKAPQGDHRDWDAIDAWAGNLVSTLKA